MVCQLPQPMTDKEIQQLRHQVRKQLQQLPPSVYPYFSSLVNSTDGLNQAEAIVLAYVAASMVEPMTAIAQLESEYEAG